MSTTHILGRSLAELLKKWNPIGVFFGGKDLGSLLDRCQLSSIGWILNYCGQSIIHSSLSFQGIGGLSKVAWNLCQWIVTEEEKQWKPGGWPLVWAIPLSPKALCTILLLSPLCSSPQSNPILLWRILQQQYYKHVQRCQVLQFLNCGKPSQFRSPINVASIKTITFYSLFLRETDKLLSSGFSSSLLKMTHCGEGQTNSSITQKDVWEIFNTKICLQLTSFLLHWDDKF